MTTEQELQAWFQARKALEAHYGKDQLAFKASPQEIDLYNGKTLSPDAHQLFYRGDGHQRFDADTGQMAKTPGYWGHPESWIQLAAGAGLGLASVGAFGNASVFGAAPTAAGVGTVVGGAGAFDEAGNWIANAGDVAGTTGHVAKDVVDNLPNGSSGSGMPDWLKTLIGIGAPLASGIGEGLLTQHRNSFSGTSSDPVKLLGNAGAGLDSLKDRFTSNMDQGVSFPDAVAQDTPVFSGGGLPSPVGLLGQDPSGVRRKLTAPPSPRVGLDGQPDDAHQRAQTALSILGFS